MFERFRKFFSPHPDLIDIDGDRWVWVTRHGVSGYEDVPWSREKLEEEYGPTVALP